MDTKNKIFAVIGTVAILATAGIVGTVLFTKGDNTSTTETGSTTTNSQNTSSNSSSSDTSSNTSTSSSTNSTSASTGSYKDGTYSASVSYSVPHGAQNTLKATVTVSSGKIASVSTTDNYSDHESAMYVSDFESALTSDAKGQSIGSYSPSRIGGASLTTEAFTEALTNIASQAKV